MSRELLREIALEDLDRSRIPRSRVCHIATQFMDTRVLEWELKSVPFLLEFVLKRKII
jgi:hypothetical protein